MDNKEVKITQAQDLIQEQPTITEVGTRQHETDITGSDATVLMSIDILFAGIFIIILILFVKFKDSPFMKKLGIDPNLILNFIKSVLDLAKTVTKEKVIEEKRKKEKEEGKSESTKSLDILTKEEVNKVKDNSDAIFNSIEEQIKKDK